MRRLLVLLALLGLAAGAPAGAQAKEPCRDKIFNDWYKDGKIASTYPLSCYRDALRHIPPDVGVYSSLGDDIRLALQAAVNREHGQKVPDQVGGSQKLTSSSGGTSKGNGKGSGGTAPTSPDPGQVTTPSQTTTTASIQPTSSSSGGLPLPVLVLGGVAVALVAAGGIGLGVRRFRRS